MKLILFSLIIYFILPIIYGCSVTKSNKTSGNVIRTERNVINLGDREKTLSLKDYLIRFPGLYWSNGRIMLKENSSILSQREPLYVLDGIKIGNDYNTAVSLVDANDIKSVRVLTNASETSFYGLDGNNGVILIKSKKR